MKTRAVIWIQYLGFLTLGVALSITGPLLPAIRGEISMSYLQAGMIASGQFLGMIFTVPLGGHVADRFGKKPFLLGSGLLFVLGLLGYAISGSFPALLASCALTGIGSGGYEVGINALQADHVEAESGRAMNLLHFFFGIGAVAGPFLATFALQTRFGWRGTFAAAALLPMIVSAVLLPQRLPRAPVPPPDTSRGLYRGRTLWMFGGVLALYAGVEGSLSIWISSFWEHLPNTGYLAPSLTPVLFWLALTAGRLLCGKLTDRMGLVRFVVFASGGTLLFSLIWGLFPTSVVTLGAVFVLGFFLAGIFPTAIAHVTGLFPGHSGKVTAFLTVFSSVGGFVLPSLLGRIADSTSIGAFPLFVEALAALMFAGVRIAPRASPEPP